MSKSTSLRDGRPSSLQLPNRAHNDSASSSGTISSPVHVSQQSSRGPSPFVDLPDPESFDPNTPNLTTPKDDNNNYNNRGRRTDRGNEEDHDSDFEAWDEDDPLTAPSQPHNMPSDLRSQQHRSTKSQQPLLSQDKAYTDYASPHRPATTSRFHERDPQESDKSTTRKRYTYAACFFILSLISFTIQTETAVYIQHTLKWNKAYSML